MATRPASKLNLQELGIPDEIELVDKQARQSIENIIDDTTTSETKVWSSNKTSNAISNAVDNISVDDLTDVEITNPANGDNLTYNGTKWVNIEPKTATKTATGNPIEVSDSASAPLVKCVTEIQGSQDLHGYDKPWVGGAGKNLLNPSVMFGSLSGYYTINADESVSILQSDDRAWGYVAELPLKAGTYTVSQTGGSYNSDIRLSSESFNVGHVFTSSYTFTLTSDGSVKMKCGYGGGSYPVTYKLQIEAGSQPTAWTPYSNICPITAYTEGEIEGRGKNLALISDDTKMNSQNATITYQNGGVYLVATGTFSRSCYLFNTKVGEKYTISFYASGTGYNQIYVGDEQAWTTGYGRVEITSTRTKYTKTITATSNVLFVGFYNSATESTGTMTVEEFQIEKGETATTYEPYTSTTHTTTFPSAIYRGSEDVVNGEVTSERVKITLDGSEGSTNWRKSNSKDGSFYYIGLADRKVNTSFTCNMATCVAFDDYVYGTCSYQPNNVYVHFWLIGENKTLSDWMTWIANNPIEIEYELATPTTSSVTPTNLPIKSLSGYNHIESSTGDMEIEYITEDYQPLVDLIADNSTSDMTGATASTDGTHGLVPAPEAGDEDKFLKGDGTWGEAGGNVVYSSTPKVVGKWIDGVTDVYEVTMVTNHINPTGTDYSYFPDTFSKIISVTGSISGQVAGSSRYYAPMGGWFKQSNDNINIDCSVYLGNFGPDNVRVYYAFHDQSTITPGGMSCDEQTIVVRYLR